MKPKKLKLCKWLKLFLGVLLLELTDCVPYDFDKNAPVNGILKAKLDEKIDVEYSEMRKNQQAVAAMYDDGHPLPEGRILDLSYQGRLILHFAFDVSGSIGERHFNRSIAFAKAIVRKVGVSEHGMRVGALTFGSKAEQIFFPMSFITTEGVLDGLDEIKYTGKVERGTDRGAEDLKKAGAEIYCIGITEDVRVESLNKIASSSEINSTSHETRPNVFILENYATMDLLIEDITKGPIACERPEPLANGIIPELESTSIKFFPTNFELTYVCDVGYTLRGGDSLRFCGKNGWSGKAPYCGEIVCEQPEPLANGTILQLQSTNRKSFPYNFELTYVCNEGYLLVGEDKERICGRNGWSGRTPYCEGKDSIKRRLEAETLKRRGVELYCIGITEDMQIESLYKSASPSKVSFTPNEQHPNVFMLENYASMALLIEDIINGTLNYSQCGLGREDVVIGNRGRILGGEQSVAPWPWMAALYFFPHKSKDIDELKFKCGGSIINENFILTAAHCLHQVNFLKLKYRLREKEEIIVKLGLTDIKNETFAQEFEVKLMHIHPEYSPGKFDYDIALLQLEKPIEFSTYVRPICLPPEELQPNAPFYKHDEYGWVIGWGHEGFAAPGDWNVAFTTTKNLKELRLPIQSTENCTRSLVEKSYRTEYFTERMFCAGDGKTGNDTCKGDSGGPLMQPWRNREGHIYWTQVGIISWGIGCGTEGLYGYYTHVHRLRYWIDGIINITPES